jgi:hypothetical protein
MEATSRRILDLDESRQTNDVALVVVQLFSTTSLSNRQPVKIQAIREFFLRSSPGRIILQIWEVVRLLINCGEIDRIDGKSCSLGCG